MISQKITAIFISFYPFLHNKKKQKKHAPKGLPIKFLHYLVFRNNIGFEKSGYH
jgi:hypothetical protein